MVPSAAPEGTIETDALIVGAGPIGLFQVFQLGLLEIKAHVIDALPHAGGQCAELYPDKPIYDIPALPHCTGRELVDRLLQQVAPFAPTLHLGQEVSQVQRADDGRFHVATDRGTRFITKTLFIAAGVGAFQARRLPLDGIAKFAGSQLHYRFSDCTPCVGKRVVVVGGNEAALEAALHCAQGGAKQVVLVHRREVFQAAPETIAQLHAQRALGAINFVAGQLTGFDEHDHQLTQVHITHGDAQTRTEPVDALVVCLGLSPKLGALADWGLPLERKQVPVNTATFESAAAGIYAVGDINTYPGKRKLIVSGFHEATLAAYAAAERIFPERRVHLQYTTTSPRLHQLLGVAAPLAPDA